MANVTLPVGQLDLAASRTRCRKYRRRILDLSQRIGALHMAPAFSCLEIVDSIYFGLMARDEAGGQADTFILSKGHGVLAQYVVLEELGLLSSEELDNFCTPRGRLGGHPDRGLPGIEVSTGSLGHGLPIAVGMALADKVQKADRRVFVVLSDGELQEGSVWEALMLAPTLGLVNLIAYLDLNDFQSLGQIRKIHPNFYPLEEKLASFGWEVRQADGHDAAALVNAGQAREGSKPLLVVARTTKGKGVSFMENVPIWHYRSPSPAEYQVALRELEAN
jgi:transketolase